MILVVGAALAYAAPAIACVPIGDRATNSPADYAAFAAVMLKRATHVELVEVVKEEPFTDPDLWDRWLEWQRTLYRPPRATEWARDMHDSRRLLPVGSRFALRVVSRLKGEGPDVIHLDGRLPSNYELSVGLNARARPIGPARDFEHWVRDGAKAPFVFGEPEELSPSNLTPGDSCMPPPLRLRHGAQYLIFRGPDGHLLGPITFPGVPAPTLGYRLVEIVDGGPRRWLDAVRSAAAGP